MPVRLAGFNVDIDILNALNPKKETLLTPETFSAAYARISRSTKDVTALRREACQDVQQARRSNKKIIFEMGHHSVAEHAVFNFDVMAVSRLALEELEKFRLVSYTEKSQRYVTLAKDFVIPEELKTKKEEQRLFLDLVRRQNDFYIKAFAVLKEYTFNHYSRLAENPGNHRLLEGWAKEDARYILPLATAGQVGMTINARNLEHLFRRFALNPRREVQQLGKEFYALVEPIAPSIILFAEPSAFEKNRVAAIGRQLKKSAIKTKPPRSPDLEIVFHTPNGDDVILACLLSQARAIDQQEARRMVKKMKAAEKKESFLRLFASLEFFDSPPREFEFADIWFQAAVSASCYAQLKRHRLATLVCGDYDIKLGNTIPASISAVGLKREFQKIIASTHAVYRRIKKATPAAADYILTNSHRRLVQMKMNLRELYHFGRLRQDEHAQWDIRDLATRLAVQAKKRMPLATLLLCGKSEYASSYEKIFKRKPRYSP